MAGKVRSRRRTSSSSKSKPTESVKPLRKGTQKPCKDCGSTSRKSTYPGPRCYTCHRLKQKQGSEARRLKYVAKQYNLSPEQYEALLAACPTNAKGARVCPGCQRNKPTQVDHWHGCCPGKTSCGKCVRMLCCGPCNKVFAHFRDNPDMAERVAELLRNPPAKLLGALGLGSTLP